jgi:hypothetical protein
LKIILGHTSDGSKRLDIYKKNKFGRMMVRNKFTPYDGEEWGFDNGAFISWKKGASFDETTYLKMLDFAVSFHRPYLSILPDIVAGGNKSLEFSLSWLNRLPNEWPWYLAVQDGMDPAAVIDNIHSFSGLFLGGSDKFKKTALFWKKVAHLHKKKFHYGRAGTYRKVQHAHDCGADSLDSAFPLWTKDRFKEFITWTKTKPWEQRLFSLKELHQGY